jgi:hypothetical protein
VGQRKREMGRDAQPALPLVHRPGEALLAVTVNDPFRHMK